MTLAFPAVELRRKPKPLVRGFYIRKPEAVARQLLGKILVREIHGKLLAGRIVETEAYLGTDDAAAHSAVGETARNAVLFGEAGHAYVYFIYGMHYCFNVSCLPKGQAGGVLVRALEPIAGVDAMAANRGIDAPLTAARLRLIASGPGRLAEALGITRERDNGKDMTLGKSDLWIGDDGFTVGKIVAGPRIGITKAVEHPLRYFIAGNPHVSGKKGPASGR